MEPRPERAYTIVSTVWGDWGSSVRAARGAYYASRTFSRALSRSLDARSIHLGHHDGGPRWRWLALHP